VRVTYKTVDTCAARVRRAFTPYHYGTYEDEDELAPLEREAVVILGSGPNRIGQGVEFDYCMCARRVRAAATPATRPSCSTATRRRSRPTTTPSDRLFFEPLTDEDVLNVGYALQDAASWGW
jgi:carbamoyl-phosphate synthase large subunit